MTNQPPKDVRNHSLTHDCPRLGRTPLSAVYKADGDVLRGVCTDCESVVYGERDGTEQYTIGMNV